MIRLIFDKGHIKKNKKIKSFFTRLNNVVKEMKKEKINTKKHYKITQDSQKLMLTLSFDIIVRVSYDIYSLDKDKILIYHKDNKLTYRELERLVLNDESHIDKK